MANSSRYHGINYFIAIILLSTTTLLSSAHAQTPSTNEWIKGGAITTASTALAFGLRFVPTPDCAWCTTNSFDLAISRAWESKNRKAARITSDILTFGLVPVLAATSVLLFAPNTDAMLQDVLVIVSSATATAALTEIAKISARRQRPEAHFGYSINDEQDNRSFLSGHTSFSFSILTTSSILAFKRGSRLAPAFTALSSLVALSTGVSRIVAAKHWATDVIAGMTLGIAVGAAMPFLVLDNNSDNVASNFYAVPDPLNNGVLLGMTF